ncbi:MAG: AAA family ATPase [Candidatus Kariarchaeaceae archaeon]|jgi:transitional endoplasmic reticulum ATPase
MRKEAVKELYELIEVPLRRPELYDTLGVDPPKAIMLYGVTGTGKTYLIRKAAEKAEASLHSIDLSDISSEELIEKFHKAIVDSKPLVIYLVMHNPEHINTKVINTLCKILDGEFDIDLSSTVITGSSVRPTLPNELRRPGRFDRELEISLPSKKERLEIIENISSSSKLDSDVDFKELANASSGFTPADLIQSVRTAARYAIRQKIKKTEDESAQLEDIDEGAIFLSQNNLLSAIKDTKPTVFSEFGLYEPNVPWDTIGGHEQLKKTLWENVIEPVLFKKYYKQAGVEGIKGILLFGPPGNGKSTLARAIATAINARFLYVNSSDFTGISGNENRLRQLFEIARDVEPTLIFFDEADSLLPARESAKEETILLVNEFLTQMDGIGGENNVIIIAATNFPDKLDEAAIRTGRLELKLLVSPPNFEGRAAAFNNLTKSMNLDEEIDNKELAKLTQPQGDFCYSFSDLKAITRNAGIISAREAIRVKSKPEDVTVSMKHFIQSISTSKPSIEGYYFKDR